MDNMWMVVIGVGGLAALVVALVKGIAVQDRLRDRFVDLKDSRGKHVPQAATSPLVGKSPLAIDLIASAGINAKPQHSLNTTILRPTIGMQLMVYLFAAAMFFFLWIDPNFRAETPLSVLLGLSALVAYFVISVALYELRYDADQVEAPDLLFRRQSFRWQDVFSVVDTGQQRYRLRFDDGRRIDVFKHLVGIRDFLTIAQMHVEANSRY